MSDKLTQVDHVRKLHVEAVTAWRSASSGIIDLNAYDLLVAELCVSERLIEMPTNPAYWSIEDAAMLKVCIRHLHQTAEAYHLSQQSQQVPDTDAKIPW